MKKIFLFVLFLSFGCYAQTIEVKYYENSKAQDSIEFKAMPKNVQIAYHANLFSYKLVTNGKASIYKNEMVNVVLEDEVSEIREVNEVGDTIISITTSNGIDLKSKETLHYKDFKNNKSYDEQFYDEPIRIIDTVSVFKWRFSDDTAIILGYKCKKAVTKYYGIDVEAWYTEEIPISDGPSIYSGLPGLILKIEHNYLEIIAFDVKIKNEAFSLKPPVFKGKVFSHKTLKEYIEKKYK
uniref:GLPGLI family protein n=1 Tax=Flavobacterium sp. TaxID=239 RepID=UPI00404944E0